MRVLLINPNVGISYLLSIGVAATSENFDTESMDRIVALAYNYGVTLVDLDQVILAEKFVSKAISLLRLASSELRLWLPRMEVSEKTSTNYSAAIKYIHHCVSRAGYCSSCPQRIVSAYPPTQWPAHTPLIMR